MSSAIFDLTLQERIFLFLRPQDIKEYALSRNINFVFIQQAFKGILDNRRVGRYFTKAFEQKQIEILKEYETQDHTNEEFDQKNEVFCKSLETAVEIRKKHFGPYLGIVQK